MKHTDSYSDLSTSEQLRMQWLQDVKHPNFCNVTFRNKIAEMSTTSGPWGGDDYMYWFEDGSMILERKIVKEWQMFKA